MKIITLFCWWNANTWVCMKNTIAEVCNSRTRDGFLRVRLNDISKCSASGEKWNARKAQVHYRTVPNFRWDILGTHSLFRCCVNSSDEDSSWKRPFLLFPEYSYLSRCCVEEIPDWKLCVEMTNGNYSLLGNFPIKRLTDIILSVEMTYMYVYAICITL